MLSTRDVAAAVRDPRIETPLVESAMTVDVDAAHRDDLLDGVQSSR